MEPLLVRRLWRGCGGKLVLESVVAVVLGSLAGPNLVGQTAAHGSRAERAEVADTAVLDLNSATAVELAALPGMGPAYARRVMEYRPYSAKNQLVTRGVLPQAAYERIKDRVVAHRPPKG